MGSYPSGASPYGALDMAGNVWEWVDDWYSDSYYSISPYANPVGPATGEHRVLRGGYFANAHLAIVTTSRVGNGPGDHYSMAGFRCAADVPGN